jgi:hypothetical protein
MVEWLTVDMSTKLTNNCTIRTTNNGISMGVKLDLTVNNSSCSFAGATVRLPAHKLELIRRPVVVKRAILLCGTRPLRHKFMNINAALKLLSIKSERVNSCSSWSCDRRMRFQLYRERRRRHRDYQMFVSSSALH